MKFPLPVKFERTTFLVAISSALWLLCWFLIWRWYSLSQWLDTPFYALDKVPGHFAAPQIRLTGLLFLTLSLLHIGVCVGLAKSQQFVFNRTQKICLGIALTGVALANIFLYPIGAVDVFYYLCQLKLQFFYHQNPYLTTFSPTYQNDAFAKFSPFLGAIVVYGPAWFWVSWPAILLSGFTSIFQALIVYKIWNALFVIVITLLIYHCSAMREQRFLGAALFGLNPLVWYEAVGNAHNDIMMTAFLLAAIWAARRLSLPATKTVAQNSVAHEQVGQLSFEFAPRFHAPETKFTAFQRAKPFWILTLPFLAVAILIKPTCAPLLWIFAIWLRRAGWTWRSFVLSGALALGVACLAFWTFWSGGAMLAGWQNGIASSVNFSTGSLVSIAREWLQARGGEDNTLLLIRPVLLQWLVFITLVSPWIIRHFEHNLAVILAAFYLLAGSLFSWYLLPIIAVLSLRPNRVSCAYVFIASTLAFQFNVLSVWAWFDSPFEGQPLQIHLWESVILALPLVLLAIASLNWWPRRWRLQLSGNDEIERDRQHRDQQTGPE